MSQNNYGAKDLNSPLVKATAIDELSVCISNEFNNETALLSEMPIEDILTLINENDATVAQQIKTQLNAVAEAVELVSGQMKLGGRLFYIGAGTSGRLGVLDSAECPPTFGTSPELVQSIIAGGHRAMLNAVENIEDDYDAAVIELQKCKLNYNDVVLGIAASGRTPFVISGLDYARYVGAKTIALTTRGVGEISKNVDVTISPDVGPEVLSGSTRMKSGTAQKMLLGMISTGVMIKLGKVHGNLMIDVVASNEKLRHRAEAMVCQICQIGTEKARQHLLSVEYNVRAAVLMDSLNINAREAVTLASRPFESLEMQMKKGS